MKIKKATAILVVGVFALSITACNTGTNKNNELKKNKKQYINIGHIISTTGPGEETSNNISSGIKIAANEINDNGGIEVNGEKYFIKYMTADDKENKDVAVNAYHNLKDKNIDALIAPINADSCLTVEKNANEDNIPMMITNVSDDNVGKCDNEFRITLSDKQRGIAIADYVYDDLELRRVVTFCEDKYKGVVDSFIEEFESKGGTIVLNNTYENAGSITQESLLEVANATPDLIFMPDDRINAEDHLNILNSVASGCSVMGLSSWYDIDATNDKYSEIGSIYYMCENKEDSLFVAQYGDEEDMTRSLEAEYGYDAVYVLKKAIEEAGAVDGDLTIAAMSMIELDGYTGEGIRFNESSDNQKKISFRTIK